MERRKHTHTHTSCRHKHTNTQTHTCRLRSFSSMYRCMGVIFLALPRAREPGFDRQLIEKDWFREGHSVQVENTEKHVPRMGLTI